MKSLTIGLFQAGSMRAKRRKRKHGGVFQFSLRGLSRYTDQVRYNMQLLTTVKSDHAVEAIMRIVCTEFGSCAALCTPPLALSDARDFGVTHTHSQAWRMGRAVAICRQTKYEVSQLSAINQSY